MSLVACLLSLFKRNPVCPERFLDFLNPLVPQAFNLTEGERALLLQAGVGEGLFFAGLKHVAIKIVPSYTEDQIITTNPEQILEIKGLKEKTDN